MRRWIRIIFVGMSIGFLLTATWIVFQVILPSPLQSARAQTDSNKPIEGWIVCKDLGVGPVPGLSDVRQRFKLCHPSGWEVLTYCLRPGLPQPSVGAQCTRTGADTYWCGRGIQPVKEYTIIQIPTDTPPVPTATSTPATPPPSTYPTKQPEQKPTQPRPLQPTAPIATRRPPPGGPDLQTWLGSIFNHTTSSGSTGENNAADPTPTPFRPANNQNIPAASPEAAAPSVTTGSNLEPVLVPMPGQTFTGIDFSPGSQRISIRVLPSSKRINNGNPISIKFFPSDTCKFGDQEACVYEYLYNATTPVTWISIHSGIGGEAQAFRSAVEGTSIDRASLSLSQINQNINILSGAYAEIHQGDTAFGGLVLEALVRIPSNQVSTYLNLPVESVMDFVIQTDPATAGLLSSGAHFLVVETCGWRVPGEPTTRGLPNTSSSIYLGIIRWDTGG